MPAMMTLSQIALVGNSVDGEWCSPVADAAGAAWGLERGALRWWRSSASHVFVAPPGVDPRGVLYARFAPAGTDVGDRLVSGIAVHARLEERAADVAGLLRSASGSLVETVSTPVGDMVVAVVAAVDGEELVVGDLDPEKAYAWGDALARLHDAAGQVGETPAPASPFTVLVDEADWEVAQAARTLERVYSDREPSPLVIGHGDFELDNLRWVSGRFVCFDFDEAGPMAAITDLAKATDDLVGDAAGLSSLLDDVLRGYCDRSGGSIAADDLLLDRAALAARALAASTRIIDLTAHDEPQLAELREKLVQHATCQRARLLDTARTMG